MAGRVKSRVATRDKEKSSFSIFVRLFTDERFPLKNITNDMKISELKEYMEFATGIPVHMQRISYLDEGDLLNHTDMRQNDIVPGATLQLRVWPMWKDLIEAVSTNDIEWVFKLGVCQPTDYHTPGSEYMTKRARKAWFEERAFLALFIAAHRGHETLVKKLLDSGADVNACTPLGRSPLHVAAAQGRGNIVDLLLERGADIDAEDEYGESALSIAAKFGHKTCERHLFLFRWQERAKRTRPGEEPARMAHQYFDSSFPVWLRGNQCQLYYTNILPPSEFEGTRLNSPKKRTRNKQFEAGELEFEDDDVYAKGYLPAIKDEKRRARSVPIRGGTKRGVSYDAWLARKKSAEQKLLNIKRAEEERKRLEEEERKQQEAEKSQSYETWLAQKEVEQKATTTATAAATNTTAASSTTTTRKTEPQQIMANVRFAADRHDGFLRSYLRSLDQRRQGAVMYRYEDWLDEKEETVLGFPRTKTTAT